MITNPTGWDRFKARIRDAVADIAWFNAHAPNVLAMHVYDPFEAEEESIVLEHCLWAPYMAALVFVPVRYVYPSRTPVLRGLTIALGVIWGALMIVLVWQMPAVSRPVFWLSLVFPAYYLLLSLGLELRR